MFKVGDEVECFKLTETFWPERLGQKATVIGICTRHKGNIVLSEPFKTDSSYRAECFRLVDFTLENE